MTIAVTIRSLLLLGYDDSSSLIFETSFDKPNERLLLTLLHFLLSIIEGRKSSRSDDEEDAHLSYASLSRECFPYYDTKSKNVLRKIICDQLYKIADKHLSSSINSSSGGGGAGSKALQLKDINASIFSLCKGQRVWNLLRKLSNLALDARIEDLLVLYSGTNNTLSINSMENNAFAYSKSVYFCDAYDGDGNGDDNRGEENKSTRECLSQHVSTQCSSFRKEAAVLVHQQEQYVEYSKELAARLKTATKTIENLRTKITTMGGDTEIKFIVSDAGKLQRTGVLLKLREVESFFL